MKTIILQFYSSLNFGDDLFVKTFSDYFDECAIRLIVNPRCIPHGLGKNVTVHPYSYINFFWEKLRSLSDHSRKIEAVVQKCADFCLSRVQSHADAFVLIGGSIFMEHAMDCPELDFTARARPDFTIRSYMQNRGNAFVIGANLGPAYSEGYWTSVRQTLLKYKHVCLRDYASYSMVSDLPHVQYAPDILFLVPKPNVKAERKTVVISVMDISRMTRNQEIITAYYRLLCDVADRFSQMGMAVTLVSLCGADGDEEAAQKIIAGGGTFVHRVSTCFYRGDMQPILELFAKASFVVASRFHSLIFALSFGKPVFPIVYNCKTAHYLQDLQFSGNYSDLKSLPKTSCTDVLYNFEKNIVTDCQEHKQYAENQFLALREYLEESPSTVAPAGF